MGLDDNHSHFGNGRVTAPRRAIAEAVDGLEGAFTVEELAEAVGAISPSTGTATVYRAVAAMEAAGSIERVGLRDGSALFVRCRADGHHHHLICTGCWMVAHAECPLDAETSRRVSEEGFLVTSHEITLYGLCPECAARQRTDTSPRKD